MTLQRYAPSPAELADFEWERMPDPRWVEIPWTYVETREGGAWSEGGATRVLLSSGPPAMYSPLKSEPALFRKFAALPDTEEAFARFGEQYGAVPPFGEFIDDETEAERWDPAHSGDTLGAWSTQRQMLARAVRLWDALRAGRPQDVIGTDVQLFPDKSPVRQRVCWCVHLAVDSKDSWMEAGEVPRSASPAHIVQVALAGMVDFRSSGRIVLARAYTPEGSAGLRLTYRVDDLSQALWLQLALAIDGNRRYETCPVCGEQWDATDARSDRQTCSDRCRKARNREGQRLAEDGHTAAEIVQRTGVTLAQAEDWLAAAAKRRKGGAS